ncbi:MAG: hypothetical protein E6J13_07210 [Chloroflexi bacterium]|nr:MAG: hypothetical protein E6J13_07210 [Chloroflexota bacterium]
MQPRVVTAVAAVRARQRPHPAISDIPVHIDAFTADGGAGDWTVRWRIENVSDQALRLVSAIQPHSQFRTPMTPMDVAIAPGTTTDLRLGVRFVEPPGSVVENAFLIIVLRGELSYQSSASGYETVPHHFARRTGPSAPSWSSGRIRLFS